MIKVVNESKENVVVKVEKVDYQHFVPLPQRFEKASYTGWFNPLPDDKF